MTRTLEQRLKFDHGLPHGQSLVEITHEGRTRLALVAIGKRGAVSLIFKPRPEDMYSRWSRIKGDTTDEDRQRPGILVWAARDPAVMDLFNGTPVAVVPLHA